MNKVKLKEVLDGCVRTESGHFPIAKAPDGFPFESLNPLQTVFYKTYKGGNALVVAPTSSGKTGVGMLFLKGRGVYATPTKALASEIYEKFVEVYGRHKVGLKTGDVFDEYYEDEKDIYVCTYESLANAFRTRKPWAYGSAVLDEIHHIYKERGVVVEEILAYLHLLKREFLALSATIPDPEGLAEMVGADYLLISDYRPIPVYEEYERISGRSDEKLAEAIMRKLLTLPPDEQVLVFVYKKNVGYLLLRKLDTEGFSIFNETLPFVPNRYGEDVAFHNADIPAIEREKIEEAFREGRVRWLVATQTLAYGVNLPADRVLILVRRMRRKNGVKFLPDSLDILQMKGRAGRYGIKDRGFVNVLVVTRSKNPMKEILEDLANKRPFVEESEENGFSLEEYWGISSQVALMILGAISSGMSWRDFLKAVPSLRGRETDLFDEIHSYLVNKGFITEDNTLTPIGEVMLKNSISPLAYDEMRRRLSSNLDDLLSVRPLMYMKKIKGSLKSFIPYGDYFTYMSMFKSAYYDVLTLDDGSDELWMFVSGKLFDYPNISNPPGELAFSRSDLFHLSRMLVALHREGYIFTTVEWLLRILHSYRYGLPYDFSPLGGIEGIGFVRAGALYRVMKRLGVDRVDFGPFTFQKDLNGPLLDIFSERYKDVSKARRETEFTLRLIEGERYLVDRRLLDILSFAILGREALSVSKAPVDEVMDLLKESL